MASLVHLVRHGEVENPNDIVYADLAGFYLSERGRRQADWAGDYLASRPIKAVYTSPLDRATETASPIAAPHDLDPGVIEDLTEWALMSWWRGLRWPDLNTYRPGELEMYLTRPVEVDFAPESISDLATRMVGAVSELAGQHPRREIVIVSHQDPIQVARLSLISEPLHRLHVAKPRHCEVISLIPGTRWRESARRAPDC